jgi:hypothetical protein
MTAPQISTTFDPPVQTDSKTTFDTKAFGVLAALNPWSSQANALGVYLDNISEFASAYEALVNFKGAWGGLSGALAMPATVSHSGAIYALTADVADVTAHTPGVSSSWQLVRTNSAQISHLAGSVSDALVALQNTAPNYFMNPLFRGNSRQLSTSVTLSAGARGHDCWKAGAAGCTYTLSGSVLTITSGTLIQVLDGRNFISDGLPGLLDYYTVTNDGTAMYSVVPAGPTYTGTTTFTSLVGANVTVEFSGGTIENPRMALGSYSPAFYVPPVSVERAALDYYVNSELLICSSGDDVWTGAVGANTAIRPIGKTHSMRAVGNLSYINNTGIQYLNGSSVWTSTTLSAAMRGVAGAQAIRASVAVDAAASRYVRQSGSLNVWAVVSAEL